MEQQKSIKKNILMNVIRTSSNFIFPLITYSYVARVLTPTGTGKVAFVNSNIEYFSYLAMLGIPTYGLREVAKVRDKYQQRSQVVQEILCINCISTIISYITLFIAVLLIPKYGQYRMLFTIMSSSILLNTIGMEWVYEALEEYNYITIRSIAFKFISVILTFLLIHNSDDYLWYGFISIFTVSASNVLNFINIKKYISFKKTHKYNLRRHLPSILTLFSASIIITIYANFDITMIGFISTVSEVGLYNAASKIKGVVLSFSTAITSVLIPRLSYYIQNGERNRIEDLLAKSLRISLLIAVPASMFIAIFPKNVLELIAGKEYVGASNTLRVLMICVIPLCLTNLYGNQILIPIGKEKRYSQSVFIGMWINLILNSIMIPLLGSFGAAIATLITEIWNYFWMSTGAPKFKQTIIAKVKLKPYILSLLASSLICIITNCFTAKLISVFTICVNGIVFFLTYYLFLLIQKEPILDESIHTIISKMKK